MGDGRLRSMFCIVLYYSDVYERAAGVSESESTPA